MSKLSLLAFVALSALGQPAPKPVEPFAPLAFLEGTWNAQTSDASTANVLGSYTFQRELGGHILARHGITAGCKAPADFDCEHRDLLYIYEETPGRPLKAIYFDSEGHTIHYTVSTPTPTTALFLSDPAPGPRFRLLYERTGANMSGKFQMQLPGQTEWKSYLEWSGGLRK
jgi:hypothetical protein